MTCNISLYSFQFGTILTVVYKSAVYSKGRDPHTSVQSSRVAREGLLPPRMTRGTFSDLLSPQIHERVRMLETMGPQSNNRTPRVIQVQFTYLKQIDTSHNVSIQHTDCGAENRDILQRKGTACLSTNVLPYTREPTTSTDVTGHVL